MTGSVPTYTAIAEAPSWTVSCMWLKCGTELVLIDLGGAFAQEKGRQQIHNHSIRLLFKLAQGGSRNVLKLLPTFRLTHSKIVQSEIHECASHSYQKWASSKFTNFFLKYSHNPRKMIYLNWHLTSLRWEGFRRRKCSHSNRSGQLACIIIDLISLVWGEWAGLLLSNLVVPYETTRITGATTVYMGCVHVLHGGFS